MGASKLIQLTASSHPGFSARVVWERAIHDMCVIVTVSLTVTLMSDPNIRIGRRDPPTDSGIILRTAVRYGTQVPYSNMYGAVSRSGGTVKGQIYACWQSWSRQFFGLPAAP